MVKFLTYQKKAQEILIDYNWPGNVRELENVLQRAIVLSENQVIDENHIMIDIKNHNHLYNNLNQNLKQAAI